MKVPPSLKNWSMCFACGFVTIMFSLLGFVGWLIFFDTPYLSYKNLPFPTLVPKVRAGEIVPLHVVRCNSDDEFRTYNTTHSIIDISNESEPKYYILPDVRIIIAPGCHSSTNLVNQLPEHLPPGKYRVFGTAEVKGILRDHHIDWYSQPFEVIP